MRKTMKKITDVSILIRIITCLILFPIAAIADILFITGCLKRTSYNFSHIKVLFMTECGWKWNISTQQWKKEKQ